MSTATPRINYLNNRDILKEIHLSKNTYCSYRDAKEDHQYDIILPSVDRINRNTLAEARRNRADRIRRETGVEPDVKKMKNTEVVVRVMTWEHIPLAPKKVSRQEKPKKSRLEDILEFTDLEAEEIVAEDIIPAVDDLDHIRLNFPPFFHYRVDEQNQPYLVGKSHWRGDLDTGEFSRDHGNLTRKLATMYLKLCERYATRSNWRGYTYVEEMKGSALLQLSQIGLKFDESKSQNPFAYYTAAITNSFTRVLNEEKKNQNIRDDILELNGLNPSWTRQFASQPSKSSE